MANVRETKTRVTAGKKAKKVGKAKVDTTKPTPTPEQRRLMIQQAAYLRAEKRGFQGGDPTRDWLDAEREIDAALRGKSRKTGGSTN